MTSDQQRLDRAFGATPIHSTLLAFPIACFSLALLTDVAYSQTVNLQWLHFSEWLLLAGLVFGALELLALIFDLLFRKVRPSWLPVLGGVVVLVLATINSFVHTVDGWTAVVPYGLALSIATVLVMILTAWTGRWGWRHV